MKVYNVIIMCTLFVFLSVQGPKVRSQYQELFIQPCKIGSDDYLNKKMINASKTFSFLVIEWMMCHTYRVMLVLSKLGIYFINFFPIIH